MSFNIGRGASCLRVSEGLFWKEKGCDVETKGPFPVLWLDFHVQKRLPVTRDICGHHDAVALC